MLQREDLLRIDDILSRRESIDPISP